MCLFQLIRNIGRITLFIKYSVKVLAYAIYIREKKESR